ncbi:MAG: hypothetical protein AB8B64_07730 [Granulosicoccus sp.]
MSDRKVSLLLPGYIENRFLNIDPSSSVGSAPAPETLSFSEDLDRQPWQSQLANILKLDTADGKRLPAARVGLLDADQQGLAAVHTEDTALVRADPISLKADRDSATLISPEQLLLTQEESVELILALNEFVAEDGLTFFSRDPVEWYMSGKSASALDSYPPSFLANRNASTFLPDGDGAATWRRLMTEIQMLLHAHPVNREREQRGLMPVNSVWFWGGAPLPPTGAQKSGIILFADDRQARLLARHLGVTCMPLPNFTSALNDLPQGNDIVVLDLSVFHAWLNKEPDQFERELARINEQWLPPLCRHVSSGELERVQLLTEDGLQGVCDQHTQHLGVSVSPTSWLARLRDVLRR